MRNLLLAGLTLAALTVPLVSATHIQGCVPVTPDPASYLTISVGAQTFYQEERGNPFGFPVPLSGYLFGPDADGDGIPEPFQGEGSYTWEETNGEPGLQYGGGIGLLGDWFPPGCDQNPDWQPTDGTIPCLIVSEDPIDDQNCGHPGDTLLF